jgi:hypothetical protein
VILGHMAEKKTDTHNALVHTCMYLSLMSAKSFIILSVRPSESV